MSKSNGRPVLVKLRRFYHLTPAEPAPYGWVIGSSSVANTQRNCRETLAAGARVSEISYQFRGGFVILRSLTWLGIRPRRITAIDFSNRVIGFEQDFLKPSIWWQPNRSPGFQSASIKRGDAGSLVLSRLPGRASRGSMEFLLEQFKTFSQFRGCRSIWSASRARLSIK